MIRIAAPATSANLGIGFDCLGIALNIYNYYEVEERNNWEFSGFEKEFQNENNLFCISYKKALNKMNKEIKPLYIKIETNIPISRGLGSSASLIIGGIYAANILNGSPLTNDQMIEIASSIEGHPDNVAPALLGNLCMCTSDLIVKKVVDPKYKFYLFIPEHFLSTEEARGILPKEYSRADVVNNIASALIGIDGLTNGINEEVKKLANDRIHEPYRKTLIPEFDKVKDFAYIKGAISFLISGSGSTCMAICDKELDTSNFPKTDVKWRILEAAVENKGAHQCQMNSL